MLAGFALLPWIESTWLLLADAALMAFAFTQVSFFVHDAGHFQIFESRRHNDYLGIFVANLLLGMGYAWWCDNHNRHHGHPNEVELDPDTNIPILAFSRDQARSKTGLARLIVKYQSYLFFPMTALEAVSKRRGVILYLWQRRFKYRRWEVALTTAHYVLYLSFLFLVLSPVNALLFILVHQALYGVYMATTFAHNHIGMPLIPDDAKLSFLHREVVTARNLKSNRWTSFWWGGVDYHIEHHLFPAIPRCRLRKAQKIVKAYCLERSIPYYETGAFQSFKEMLVFLHEASKPLWRKARNERDLYYRGTESGKRLKP